jgi:O-antigen/teichoic acid export membrane protein
VTAPYIIPLFFSREFLGGSYLMIAYMPGEFCFQALSMLTAYQLTVSKRRVYLGLNLGYIALLSGGGLLLIPMLGPLGYVLAHVGASLAMAVVALIIAWRSGQIGSRQFVEFAAAALLLTLACLVLLGEGEPKISPIFALIALLPFAISGFTVLRRMRREFRFKPEKGKA